MPILLAALMSPAFAQTCVTANDMDDATRNPITAASKRFFGLAAQGDTASLKQNSVPSLASNFSGIEAVVKDHQAAFAAAQVTPRPPLLLKADGTAPLEHAEFLCGVFGSNGQTAASSVVQLNSLPPGTYAVSTLDLTSAKGKSTLSFILQQVGGDWKLGGVYAKESELTGHDEKWFETRAREFKAKGQKLNAWFYYQQARDLQVPVPFMSTLATDRRYDEAQTVKPADLPAADHPLSIVGQVAAPKPAGTKPGEQFNGANASKTYEVIDMFPTPVGNDFDLVVRYRSADISDTGKAFQDNMAVIRAVVARYPELRDSFGGVVARAVAPSGQDYGSLLQMKDIK
jgi:hypothetical protein